MSVKNIIFKLSAFYAFGACFMAVVPSASAFTFSPNNDSITVTATDINQSFKINFGGNVETKDVEGLSSEATFTFLGFTTVGSNTEAKFDISLSNTSNNNITSRTSALGFNVDKTLVGVGDPTGSGNTRVSGLFDIDTDGSFPNQFGNVDVCFTDGNTCQGGGNGGVSTGMTDTLFPILAFKGNVTSFTLSNLGVRYQSITGTNLGTSGTGKGLYVAPPPPPKQVSEPTTAVAIALFAVSASVVKKKKHLLPA